jgi:prephenate dehydratase
MTVAYLGPSGSFSHEAALAFLPEEEPLAQPSFSAIIASVERGSVRFGILPVENSIAGTVEEVRDLLAASRVRILSEHDLPVRLHLLALPGTSLEGIRTAISHPVALRQCAGTLRALGLAIEEVGSTAAAARDLCGPASAAVASEAAARAYGRIILRRDIHDRADNLTRFCIVTGSSRLA